VVVGAGEQLEGSPPAPLQRFKLYEGTVGLVNDRLQTISSERPRVCRHKIRHKKTPHNGVERFGKKLGTFGNVWERLGKIWENFYPSAANSVAQKDASLSCLTLFLVSPVKESQHECDTCRHK